MRDVLQDLGFVAGNGKDYTVHLAVNNQMFLRLTHADGRQLTIRESDAQAFQMNLDDEIRFLCGEGFLPVFEVGRYRRLRTKFWLKTKFDEVKL